MSNFQHKEPVRDIAHGKWAGILGKYLDDRTLSGKHGPCPICGGLDRFRFDDKGGNGTWICSHDGAGDGFHLLMHVNGWTFAEAAKHVEQLAPKIIKVKAREQMSNEDAKTALQRVWAGAQAVTEGDPVFRYLSDRCGITEAPKSVAYHPALSYKHEDGSITKHQAMVSRIIRADGKAVIGLHRTYLTEDGKKADLPSPRKMMTPSESQAGAAIRLTPMDDGWLGVAEGIETALCAKRLFGTPVWSCVAAWMLEQFEPPQGCRLLVIYGDNDRSFAGQKAAYTLANRLRMKDPELEVRVQIAEVEGSDFADQWKNVEVI